MASCTYTNSDKLGFDGRDGGYRDSEAQLRLQKLEEMVTSLMETNKDGFESHRDKASLRNRTGDQNFDDASAYSSPQTSESSLRGPLNVKGPEKEYVNATHWTTILENVGSPHARQSFNAELMCLDPRNPRCSRT